MSGDLVILKDGQFLADLTTKGVRWTPEYPDAMKFAALTKTKSIARRIPGSMVIKNFGQDDQQTMEVIPSRTSATNNA